MDRGRRTTEQANAWYKEQPWLVRCNFTPSTAINQLEMWQAETFDAENLTDHIARLKAHGRPLICTEYMARTWGSYFTTHLPIFEREQVGCYNWGLVSGKTQTIYPWGSKKGSPEPEVWFHDIFRKDGTPYSVKEVELIKTLTGARDHRTLCLSFMIPAS